ncbi:MULTISPECIES: DUF423 domain-containing protein [unclassified Herbaspirillum]|uniref:DUF423 domain-containing protein n=1 Tax=unclassified Herbaspirillum TaxID=2624150 RepID=UPI00115003BF|nr:MULTISPECIES: DUF423 domain-containing protein [unclassified Herbaspirillum]MBB5391688.1 uncharacterized membrane protein YgdD (TMEM256/DUF423 family) [Herbaspirillum sp. SJZ102]TQK03065.1 uncharacterized membrane protein YgdD (TMEM256/DUF423 family) [Herbaspirillum sp. SJZ130]TQK06547.1 uncharacterized membrane protein YgdD (TMEM256/DUF423 family) [Herbaspirillum sp. SJZ106]TWC62397.1 uncharacterized membrane protein YgdD (TMEM256/DUF423 family) [Herbaspirillum sp. SJZ099]
MNERPLVVAGAINMFIAVGCGAFGAHGLKKMLSEDMLAVWHTAVTYQAMHALGMIAVALLLPRFGGAMMRWAGNLMLAGIVIFSGSLYLLALTGTRVLGAITPIGGAAFLAAWLLVAWSAYKGMR